MIEIPSPIAAKTNNMEFTKQEGIHQILPLDTLLKVGYYEPSIFYFVKSIFLFKK